MSKRIFKATLMVVIAIGVGVGVAYAYTTVGSHDISGFLNVFTGTPQPTQPNAGNAQVRGYIQAYSGTGNPPTAPNVGDIAATGALTAAYTKVSDSTTSGDYSYAQLNRYKLFMTTSNDEIKMNDGDDTIFMGNGADTLSLGPNSDSINFYGTSSDTEKVVFDDASAEADQTYIKYTGSNDNVTIKSETGDVVIQLGGD